MFRADIWDVYFTFDFIWSLWMSFLYCKWHIVKPMNGLWGVPLFSLFGFLFKNILATTYTFTVANTDNQSRFHSEASCFEAFNFPDSLCSAGAVSFSQVFLSLLRLQHFRSCFLALVHRLWWLEKCIDFPLPSSCHCYRWN